MLTHPTLDKLRTMQLEGMAIAFQEQLELNTLEDLRFEERLALLVDREFAYRAETIADLPEDSEMLGSNNTPLLKTLITSIPET